MKLTQIITLGLVSVLPLITNAQPSEEKVKNAIDAALAVVQFKNATSPEFYKTVDYVRDDRDNLIGLELQMISRQSPNEQGFNNTERMYLIVDTTQQVITSVRMLSSKCGTSGVKFIWKGDKLASTFEYIFDFDELGRVKSLSEFGWASYRKAWMKKFGEFTYDNDGRVNEIIVKNTFGKGKSSSNVKVKYTDIYTTKTFEYVNDKSMVATLKYYEPSNGKGDQEARRVQTQKFSQNNSTVKIESYEGDNLAYSLSKEYVDNKVAYAKTIVHPSGQNTTVSLDYNDLGFVIKRTIKEYQGNGELKQHSEQKYTYEKKKGGEFLQPACGYSVDSNTLIYDLEGNVVKEVKGMRFRDKLANGSWSEWKNFTY